MLHRTTFRSSLKPLFEEGLKQVSKEDWSKCIEYVKKEEEKMWELDGIVEDMEERTFVINVKEGDSSETESDLAEKLLHSD